LSITDALRSIKVILASLIAIKKRVWPSLESVSTREIHTDLVYIPFQEEKGELFNPTLKISVPRNSLRFGQNL
jgi:hypothetical protein